MDINHMLSQKITFIMKILEFLFFVLYFKNHYIISLKNDHNFRLQRFRKS